MPHITCIHGIANKPSKGRLINEWSNTLRAGGLDIKSNKISLSMVYWADLLYEHPLEPGTRESKYSNTDFDQSHLVDTIGPDEGWKSKLSTKQRGLLTIYDQIAPKNNKAAEAIPFPNFVIKALMKILVRDVHHYLYNASYSPRPGEKYKIQDVIRKRVVDQLSENKQNHDGPHIVLSHSMGTVIAYDCLHNVENCPEIDSLITVGSPLGISEVQDGFIPEHDNQNSYPEKILHKWTNVYDRLDPVNLDTDLGNDYKKDREVKINSIKVKNGGRWRHSAWKYFGQEALTSEIESLCRV